MDWKSHWKKEKQTGLGFLNRLIDHLQIVTTNNSNITTLYTAVYFHYTFPGNES
jgi:hypothetical protein